MFLQHLGLRRDHEEYGAHVWWPYHIYLLVFEKQVVFFMTSFFPRFWTRKKSQFAKTDQNQPKTRKKPKIWIPESSISIRRIGHYVRDIVPTSGLPPIPILIMRCEILTEIRILSIESDVAFDRKRRCLARKQRCLARKRRCLARKRRCFARKQRCLARKQRLLWPKQRRLRSKANQPVEK